MPVPPLQPQRPPLSTSEEDLRLVRQAASGDRPSLEEVTRRILPRIAAVCRRMLSNPDDAREAAQDVVLRILTRLNQFDGRSGLATWVVRISMNHCLSLRRRQVIAARSLQTIADQAASRQRLADSDQIAAAAGGLGEDAPSVRGAGRGENDRADRSGGGRGGNPEGEPSPAPSVQFPGSASSRPSLLEQAWNTLDADAAAILLLRDVQDMEYEVIAIVLDIPVGTVKSRLFRARAALRAALEKLSPDFRSES